MTKKKARASQKPAPSRRPPPKRRETSPPPLPPPPPASAPAIVAPAPSPPAIAASAPAVAPAIPRFTIGRADEFATLLRNVAQGFPTALLGRPGIGKTHLLEDLRAALEAQPRPVIYAEMIAARETGRTIYEALCRMTATEPRKWKAGITVAEIIPQIEDLLTRFKHKEVVLLLDGAEHTPLKAEPLLRMLSDRTVVVATALYVRRNRRIQRFFWQFEKLTLKPLGRAETLTLASRLLDEAKIPVAEDDDDRLRRVLRGIPFVRDRIPMNKEYLLNRITTEAAGVPLAVVETVNRLKGAQRIDTGFIRGMFVHEAGEQWIDGAPVVLAFIVALVILKFFNRGMYRFDMYAIFGALAAVGILVRYFMLRGAREQPA